MRKKFYKKYKLIKKWPTLSEGAIIYWNIWSKKYDDIEYHVGSYEPKVRFEKDVVENMKDWFEPIGKLENYYDDFPEKITDHIHMDFECSHNSMCRLYNVIVHI